jgi:hypothetical protein
MLQSRPCSQPTAMRMRRARPATLSTLVLALTSTSTLLAVRAPAAAAERDAANDERGVDRSWVAESVYRMTTDELREALAEREAEEASEATEDAESFDGRAVPVDVEQVVIIGGGPAGLAASVYAARAGLKPLVIAPPAGGQLLGKGVDVENYPGLLSQTGPGVVQLMRT